MINMVCLTERRLIRSVLLTILSLILYLSPIDTIGNQFYLLPYRFFELTIGGLIGLKTYKASSVLGAASFVFILLMVFFGAFTIGERAMPYNLVGGTNTIRESFLPRELMLCLTVLFTSIFLFFIFSIKVLFNSFGQSSQVACFLICPRFQSLGSIR